MSQLGFLVNTRRCIGCNGCRVACQIDRGTDPATAWRSVGVFQQGRFPEVTQHTLSLACNHCRNPACQAVCPVGAIHKREGDGAVFIDPEACNGCGRCMAACPYGAPQRDATTLEVGKCDLCLERRERGLVPNCVQTCVGGALDVVAVSEMEERGAVSSMQGFADPSFTEPSTRFLRRP